MRTASNKYEFELSERNKQRNGRDVGRGTEGRGQLKTKFNTRCMKCHNKT